MIAVPDSGKHWSILRQCQERGAEAPGALDVADNIDEDAAVDYDPKGHYLQVRSTRAACMHAAAERDGGRGWPAP